MADMPQPKWAGDHQEWKRNIRSWGADPHITPVTQRAQAVATIVFHAAADYNTLYVAPLPEQLNAWAAVFDCTARDCMDWLTVDLAERAVREFFAHSTDGRLMPAHVIQKAAVIRLEDEVNHGA